MSLAAIIAIAFSTGFFVESIIGFGGGLIAYSLLGFFADDLKEMILAGLYIGTLASGHIVASDHKSFDKKIFLSLIPFSLVGTILGVIIFVKLSTDILNFIFGCMLLMLALKNVFFDHYVFPQNFKNNLVLLGGITQGAFGTGGPFLVNALKNDFKNKSALRTTMAVFFLTFNLLRICQLTLLNQFNYKFFFEIWWTIIPVFIAIKLGHLVHLKISENAFKKGISVLTILAGIKFLSKIFD